jgi:hypothetical protein
MCDELGNTSEYEDALSPGRPLSCHKEPGGIATDLALLESASLGRSSRGDTLCTTVTPLIVIEGIWRELNCLSVSRPTCMYPLLAQTYISASDRGSRPIPLFKLELFPDILSRGEDAGTDEVGLGPVRWPGGPKTSRCKLLCVRCDRRLLDVVEIWANPFPTSLAWKLWRLSWRTRSRALSDTSEDCWRLSLDRDGYKSKFGYVGLSNPNLFVKI